MKNICLLLLATLFFACSPDDCVNDIVGTYSGTNSCPVNNLDGQLILSESPEGSNRVAIQDGLAGVSGFMGDLSNDCKTISVAEQPVVDINGVSYNVSGLIKIHGASILADLIFEKGGVETLCSYDLTKN